jgi:magnesium transporter
MLNLYGIRDQRLARIDPVADSREGLAWIDLINPTAADEAEVEELLGVGIPTREEMVEIEISSRLYSENGALYMTASVLVGADGPKPQACPVTFILAKGYLVTVRYAEPGVFYNFVKQAQKAEADYKTADGVFVGLLEAVIDRTADVLEKVSFEIDALSAKVFESDTAKATTESDYKAILRKLGRNGDLNSKARESLVSVGRLVNFLTAECAQSHPTLHERTGTMSADIRSLTDHASYIASTTVFLLDATVGLITIDQNNIIKIVSVVSVVIMPPTLIASIYGMNFRFMPELDWMVGYPLALVAMVGAAILPYWYFKRRGWL